MTAKLLLLAALSIGCVGSAAGQVLSVDSLLVEIGNRHLENLNEGYGQAEVIDTKGEKSTMLVPVRLEGFDRSFPYFRTREDLEKFGKMASHLKVDKVRSLTVNGLYQEHIFVDGEPTSVLATRVVSGPCELFYAVLESNVTSSNGMVMGGMGKTVWYVRRQHEEPEKVAYSGFKTFAAEYFYDCPDLVAAVTGKGGKLRYRDMVQITRIYNRYKLRLAAKGTGGK